LLSWHRGQPTGRCPRVPPGAAHSGFGQNFHGGLRPLCCVFSTRVRTFQRWSDSGRIGQIVRAASTWLLSFPSKIGRFSTSHSHHDHVTPRTGIFCFCRPKMTTQMLRDVTGVQNKSFSHVDRLGGGIQDTQLPKGHLPRVVYPCVHNVYQRRHTHVHARRRLAPVVRVHRGGLACRVQVVGVGGRCTRPNTLFRIRIPGCGPWRRWRSLLFFFATCKCIQAF